MSGKHTSGPWIRVDTPDYAEIHPQGTRCGTPIALVAKPDDADLIAAAPELLAAIENFMPKGIAIGNGNVPDDIVVPMDVTMGELRAFEAAIAKAKGEA